MKKNKNEEQIEVNSCSLFQRRQEALSKKKVEERMLRPTKISPPRGRPGLFTLLVLDSTRPSPGILGSSPRWPLGRLHGLLRMVRSRWANSSRELQNFEAFKRFLGWSNKRSFWTCSSTLHLNIIEILWIKPDVVIWWLYWGSHAIFNDPPVYWWDMNQRPMGKWYFRPRHRDLLRAIRHMVGFRAIRCHAHWAHNFEPKSYVNHNLCWFIRGLPAK